MTTTVVADVELDTEWAELILEALHNGISSEEIKKFLQSN